MNIMTGNIVIFNGGVRSFLYKNTVNKKFIIKISTQPLTLLIGGVMLSTEKNISTPNQRVLTNQSILRMERVTNGKR